jgi:CheY-like chemotaxis protein
VLRSAAEDLRASRETVLAALERSGYEFEFAGDALRADAYVAAWAGAPVGAAGGRELSRTFMRVLKSGVSVDYLDANWKSIMEDDCCVATRLGDGYFSRLLDQWPTLPLSMPLGMQGFQNHSERDKHGVCALLKQTLDARCPLCLRVAPPVRDVLWPTREDWDGVF